MRNKAIVYILVVLVLAAASPALAEKTSPLARVRALLRKLERTETQLQNAYGKLTVAARNTLDASSDQYSDADEDGIMDHLESDPGLCNPDEDGNGIPDGKEDPGSEPGDDQCSDFYLKGFVASNSNETLVLTGYENKQIGYAGAVCKEGESEAFNCDTIAAGACVKVYVHACSIGVENETNNYTYTTEAIFLLPAEYCSESGAE